MANKKDVASFNRLNYAAFENIVFPRCAGRIKYTSMRGFTVYDKLTRQAFDLHILLRSGFSDEDFAKFYPFDAADPSIKSRLSNMRKPDVCHAFIRDFEVNKYAEPETLDNVYSYFVKHLLPLLSNSNLEKVINDIYSVFDADWTVPTREYWTLRKLYERKEHLSFLAEAFRISMIRDTLPEKIAYRRFTPEGCELFSEIEDFIRKTHIDGFDFELYAENLNRLSELLDTTGSDDFSQVGVTELFEVSWNAVAFWKICKQYVDEGQLSDELRSAYDKVRTRAFKIESYDYIWSVRDNIQKLRAEYGLDDTTGVMYQESEIGDWRIIVSNNFE